MTACSVGAAGPDALPATGRPAVPGANGPTVLLVDGQARAAVAYVRSLGQQGARVIVSASRPEAMARFSRYCDGFARHPDPVLAADEFLAWIERFAHDAGVHAILPMDDETTATLVRALDGAHALPNGGAALLLPSREVYARAFDKWETIDWARRLSVPTPATEVARDPVAAAAAAERIGYPLILKPRSSSGSRGLAVVERPDALSEAWHAIVAGYGVPLIQERIPATARKVQVAVILDRASRVRGYCVQELLRQFPIGGGPGTFVETITHDHAAELALRLLQGIGWIGAAVVEFLIDPRTGSPKLMEINPRPWGTTGACVHAGVNVPGIVLAIALTGECPPVGAYTVGQRWRWLLPGECLYFLYSPHRWDMSPAPWQFGGIADLLLSADDPGPAIGFGWSLLSHAFDRAAWHHVFRRGVKA